MIDLVFFLKAEKLNGTYSVLLKMHTQTRYIYIYIYKMKHDQ